MPEPLILPPLLWRQPTAIPRSKPARAGYNAATRPAGSMLAELRKAAPAAGQQPRPFSFPGRGAPRDYIASSSEPADLAACEPTKHTHTAPPLGSAPIKRDVKMKVTPIMLLKTKEGRGTKCHFRDSLGCRLETDHGEPGPWRRRSQAGRCVAAQAPGASRGNGDWPLASGDGADDQEGLFAGSDRLG